MRAREQVITEKKTHEIPQAPAYLLLSNKIRTFVMYAKEQFYDGNAGIMPVAVFMYKISMN